MIATIQDNITASRGDRNRLRDSIYDDIDVKGYDEILQLYDQMRLSGARVGAEVAEDRRRRRRELALVIGGVILGFAGLIEFILSFFRH
jgi:hypothetical protein